MEENTKNYLRLKLKYIEEQTPSFLSQAEKMLQQEPSFWLTISNVRRQIEFLGKSLAEIEEFLAIEEERLTKKPE